MQAQSVKPMDECIEAFRADVSVLEGEHANAVGELVRGVLADYERLFRVREANKRMKDKGSPRMPRALPFTRSRGNTVAQGNPDGRALKAGLQRSRRAALSGKRRLATAPEDTNVAFVFCQETELAFAAEVTCLPAGLLKRYAVATPCKGSASQVRF